MSNPSPPSTVLVDATAVYSDPRLTRAHFRLVRRQAEQGAFALVVPEVVVREVVAKFAERAEAAYARMLKGADELERLGLPRPITDAESQAEAVRVYEAELRSTVSAAGCDVATIPSVPHGELVDRAVERRKPFNNAGAGYRDALIWETVVARAADGVVAFVTNNTDDFCNTEKTGLADDLLRDLTARGLPRTQVIWFSDLRSFIDVHVPRSERTLEEVRDKIQREPDLDGLFGKISAAADGFSLDNVRNQLHLPTDTDSPTVQWFEPEVVEVVDAHPLDSDEVVLDLVVSGEACIDCYVPKWSWDSDDDVSIEDADWNEHYMWASATRRLELSVTASYDPADESVSGVDVVEIEAEGRDATEPENLFQVRWSTSGHKAGEEVRWFSVHDPGQKMDGDVRAYVYTQIAHELSDLGLQDDEFVVVRGTFRYHGYDLTGTVARIMSAAG